MHKERARRKRVLARVLALELSTDELQQICGQGTSYNIPVAAMLRAALRILRQATAVSVQILSAVAIPDDRGRFAVPPPL